MFFSVWDSVLDQKHLVEEGALKKKVSPVLQPAALKQDSPGLNAGETVISPVKPLPRPGTGRLT